MKKAPRELPAPLLPASSPCLLPEVEVGADPQQASDVARWRKIERERLIQARARLSPQQRAEAADGIASQLTRLLPSSRERAPVISVYWPIRAEPDLRPWMQALAGVGIHVALPVAVALARPLVFREWHPQMRMARGLWNIPHPAEGEVVVPDVVVAPLVGFDRRGYRLGYGGGFFDRTLAQLNPKPLTLGVGYRDAELPTIFPQPHDIPMDWLVTPAAAFRVADARAEAIGDVPAA